MLYHFKPLTIHDLPEIMAIEREVFNPPWSAATMKDSLRAAHSQVWGLVLNDTQTLIGFGVLSVILDEAELLSLAIAPRYQGNGYGKMLLEFLIDKAKTGGAESLYLEVRVSHEVALSLYGKLGFKEMGRRKDYYPVAGDSRREDALLLTLRLNQVTKN